MWRAFFLAMGCFVMLLGAQFLAVERMTLKIREAPPPPVSPFDTTQKTGALRQVIPPPWAPWSLLSAGAVVCLYSFTIPRRVAGK